MPKNVSHDRDNIPAKIVAQLGRSPRFSHCGEPTMKALIKFFDPRKEKEVEKTVYICYRCNGIFRYGRIKNNRRE